MKFEKPWSLCGEWLLENNIQFNDSCFGCCQHYLFSKAFWYMHWRFIEYKIRASDFSSVKYGDECLQQQRKDTALMHLEIKSK